MRSQDHNRLFPLVAHSPTAVDHEGCTSTAQWVAWNGMKEIGKSQLLDLEMRTCSLFWTESLESWGEARPRRELFGAEASGFLGESVTTTPGRYGRRRGLRHEAVQQHFRSCRSPERSRDLSFHSL